MDRLAGRWGGTNCTSTHDEVARLIDDKQVEIAARIEEFTAIAAQLDSVRTILESSPSRTCAGPT